MVKKEKRQDDHNPMIQSVSIPRCDGDNLSRLGHLNRAIAPIPQLVKFRISCMCDVIKIAV